MTNLENGKTLIVRVNDRGPFSKGRIIDVSKRSAELLGFKNQGTAKVKLQVLNEESRAIAEAARRGESTAGVEVAMNERPSTYPGKRTAPPQQPPRSGYETVSSKGVPTKLEPVERVALNNNIQGHNVDGRFYPDPVVKRVPVPNTNIFVQAGSFTEQSRAQALATKLSPYGQAQVYPAVVNGRQYYRVRFPSSNVATADRILASLTQAGMDNAIIVVE